MHSINTKDRLCHSMSCTEIEKTSVITPPFRRGCHLMAAFNHEQFKCCFQKWIVQQREDLEEPLNADSETTDDQLMFLCEKVMIHLEEYYEQLALMAKTDAPSFLSPSWCTSFKNSFLWIGGCRPSLSVRLVYSVCGSELDAQLAEFLRGERKGNLADLSAQQMAMINTLHCKIVKEEGKMSSKMASLQDEIADNPLVMIAKRARRVGESSQDLDSTMDVHSLSLASMLNDADMLRINTLKELIEYSHTTKGRRSSHRHQETSPLYA